jgi:L-ascorbate metabolism protein UlaG (beta-lactamase superfamily)
MRELTSAVAILVGLQALAPAAPQVPQPTVPAVSVRYVANAGVLIGVAGAKVLIDAPIRDGISPYATSTPAERASLEGAAAPYDNVDAVLVTHWHEDHFSAEAVAAHLSRNTRGVLISSPEVVERVRTIAPGLPAAQLRGVLPAPGASELVTVGRLPIRVLRIRHNPTRRLPEQHVGFLVGDNPAILHTGDADPKPDNFTLLRGLPRVDVALVPYWFMLDDANRRFVSQSIVPRRVLAMHLPPRDAADAGRKLSAPNVAATLLVTPGTLVQ